MCHVKIAITKFGSCSGLVNQIVIIFIVFIFSNFLSNFRVFLPCYIVFHAPGNEKCRISHCFNSNFDIYSIRLIKPIKNPTSLLNVGNSLFQGLCHFQSDHDHRQPSATKCGHGQLFAESQVFLSRNYTHFIQFV